MNLARNEDQRLIESSALDWLAAHYGFRAREASVHRDGGSASVWQAFAGLGWLGMPLPAAHEGLELGSIDCGVLLHAMGRHLVVEPVHACVHEAASLLAEAGSPEQQAQWLPGVVDGGHRLALAHGDSTHMLPWDVPALRATPTNTGWRLDGVKRGIAAGPGAKRWIVSALTAQGQVTLFLVDPQTEGLHVSGFDTTDGRRAADAVFDGVALPNEARLSGAADQAAVLRRVMARATVLRCWEAAGVMQAAVEQTVAYTRQRQQFGQSISQFQVVQHRLAEMAVHAAEALAACELATMRLELAHDPVDAASMARTKVVAGSQFVAKEAVQLHGAMGVCEELPIAATFRHLLAFSQVDGSAARHASSRGHGLLVTQAHETSQTL